jgi:hypothetical protein
MLKPPTTWREIPAVVEATLSSFVKQANEDGFPVVSQLADVLGWRAGPINAHWGGPRPLTNTLIGAGLGALLGYGGGRVAEQFLPEDTLEPKALAKRTAVLGGLLGGLPGLYQTYDNARMGESPLALWPPEPGESGVKRANFFDPSINRASFEAAVYADPFTPRPVQAASAGLVAAASAVKGSPLVSPWDVTRIALGAGSGLAAGTVVGKVFGALAGLTPESQQKLQQAGMWAGVLKAVVPPAVGFG